MKNHFSVRSKAFFALTILAIFSSIVNGFARVGGAGGHGSHSSSSHSSSSYSHGYSGGGGSFSPGMIVLIIIIIILYLVFKNKFKGMNMDGNGGENFIPNVPPATSYPEGLTQEKVMISFMALQDAWMKQDLKAVRKWMSDGVYQRFTAQFAMMKKLSQRNMLSNIRVHSISPVAITADGNYQSVDVAVTFSMDDSFTSDQYPALNESYAGDTDMEYWTFIRRNDAKPNADLYHTNNCPNCGAPIDENLGEVSRCPSCKTLTNNASYDWILSEITQDEDYEGANRMAHDAGLHQLTKNDNLFSVQRMEDIASNVFMQIMEVMTGDKPKKLTRFAPTDVADKIMKMKASVGNFVFDRLYLNDVTLTSYNSNEGKLNLVFDLAATYQRVQPGVKLTKIDPGMDTHRFRLVLSKDLAALQQPEKEIAFSYECANCGAPYDDTTNDVCGYCDAPVVDTSRNWVLTDFMAEAF